MSERTENHIPLYLIPIVALGFATTQISWGLFNLTVPIILTDKYEIPIALIGFIMTWDNILAFFIQPTVGTYSDSVRTRFGRRLPFIIPGVLFGSLFFFLLSISRLTLLPIFLINIVIFNIIMALYRAPSASLMPDMVKSGDRSIANGIGNFTGGITAGLGLLFVTYLFDSGRGMIEVYAFIAVLMVVFLVILITVITEPDEFRQVDDIKEAKAESKQSGEGIGKIIQDLKDEVTFSLRSNDRSLIFMLIAITSWFMAVNSIEAFYSTFVWQIYLPDVDSDVATSEAGKIIFVFPIIFVIFALLGGLLGTKIGRIRTSKIGSVIMILGILFTASIRETSTLGLPISWQDGFRVGFILAGSGWGLVTVNSIVIMWEHTKDNGVGTGLYYAFTSAAAVLGPTLAGLCMSIFGVTSLFYFTVIFFLIGSFFMFKVNTGEAGDRGRYRMPPVPS